MNVLRVLASSVRAVLGHPRWSVLSLAAFLVRGGILVLLVALIPLPTTAALANALGPTLVGFVFGGPSASFLLLVGSIVVAVLIWLLLSGLIGAALDLALVRAAAEREAGMIVGMTSGSRSGRGNGLWGPFFVRLVAHVPTAVVAVWGATALVDAAYAELISPGDPAIPLALRVVFRVPMVIGLLIGAWAVGEAAGGVAVRYLAWGSGAGSSLRLAVQTVLRPSAVLILIVTDAVLAAMLLLSVAGMSQAFDRARFVLLDGGGPLASAVSIAVLAATCVAAMLLVSVATTYRAVAWTTLVLRRRQGSTLGTNRHP